MAEGCKTEHLTALGSPACCSNFSSEGFEFLQFACLSNTNILNVCSGRYRGCFPTSFAMSWGCLKGWQKLVSDTIQSVCTRLPAMPDSYDFVMLQVHTFISKWTGHSLPVYEKTFQKTINRFFPVLWSSWEHSQMFLCWDVGSCRKVKVGVFHAQHHTIELRNISAQFIQRSDFWSQTRSLFKHTYPFFVYLSRATDVCVRF